MTAPLHVRAEPASDAELISAVRDGDTEAYGELFARHVAAARRLSRQLVSGGDVDDLVSEAFAKVLVVLQRGEGPDLAFRAYLLTAVRRLHVDRVRATARTQPTDDLTPYDPGVPFRDTAVEGFDNAAAAKAFASLPERWQMVLWHIEVEQLKPAEVAPLLGMSANSVSALAYRAREGLRQAFLTMHAQEAHDEECAWTQDALGPYIRGGASRRDGAKVESHLDECRRCMGLYLELTEVNSNLRGILAPLVLGSAAAGYLKGAGAGAGMAAGLTGGLESLKNLVRQNAATSAVVGGVAAAVVVAGVVLTVGGDTPAPAPERAGGETPGVAEGDPGRDTGREPGSAPQPRPESRPVPASAPDTTPTTAADEPRPAPPATPSTPSPGTTPPPPPPSQPAPSPSPPASPAPSPTPSEPGTSPPAAPAPLLHVKVDAKLRPGPIRVDAQAAVKLGGSGRGLELGVRGDVGVRPHRR